MLSKDPQITLLGNNSGRNLGDAAILASILDVFSRELPKSRFYVPTISPRFVNDNYATHYNVKGINILPWTGSLRLLGIPTLWCIARSNVVMICNGIIFGRKLFSPHNFLITLIFLVPWAKLFGCKIVCYSCGIGPFPSSLSKLFARWVMNGSDLVIMRDYDSKKLAEKIGVTQPIEVTGDAAFLNPVSDDHEAQRIASKEGIDLGVPTLGLNVTPYIDSWLRKSERVNDPSNFLPMLAEGLALAEKEIARSGKLGTLGTIFQKIVFSASPMDEEFSYEFAKLTDGKVIHNSRYLSHDIQSLMRRCELFIGMRFHSLVLSSAVGVPVVGLVYAPKVRGYMRLLGCEDLAIELSRFTSEGFAKKIVAAWTERHVLKQRQQRIVDELKRGAQNAAIKVKDRYFPETKAIEANPTNTC